MESVTAASERVVVLMSRAEKQALDAKAASAGHISAGELLRRNADRLTPLETIIEIARPEGMVLRIASAGRHDPDAEGGSP
jgi:hypothetical protein